MEKPNPILEKRNKTQLPISFQHMISLKSAESIPQGFSGARAVELAYSNACFMVGSGFSSCLLFPTAPFKKVFFGGIRGGSDTDFCNVWAKTPFLYPL